MMIMIISICAMFDVELYVLKTQQGSHDVYGFLSYAKRKKKQGNKMLKIDVISLLSQTRNIQTEFYRLYKTTTF